MQASKASDWILIAIGVLALFGVFAIVGRGQRSEKELSIFRGWTPSQTPSRPRAPLVHGRH
jgi:hypothetical protein